jgi:hypothetical protein
MIEGIRCGAVLGEMESGWGPVVKYLPSCRPCSRGRTTTLHGGRDTKREDRRTGGAQNPRNVTEGYISHCDEGGPNDFVERVRGTSGGRAWSRVGDATTAGGRGSCAPSEV